MVTSALGRGVQEARAPGRSPRLMARIRTFAASLVSVLCMAALFVAVALAAGPPARQPAEHGKRPQGVCFLHELVR
jgi:hypothetical protein